MTERELARKTFLMSWRLILCVLFGNTTCIGYLTTLQIWYTSWLLPRAPICRGYPVTQCKYPLYGARLLTDIKMPDEEAFSLLVRLMYSYGLRGHFLPEMPRLQLRLVSIPLASQLKQRSDLATVSGIILRFQLLWCLIDP
jgi:hypothetical protein